MQVDVRKAGLSDVATVASILQEAARWLEASGIPMWRTNELGADTIAADVAEGLFWIAEVRSAPAGTVKLQFEDPEFWPDVPHDDSAFLHRLVVRREFAGGAVSSALLSFGVEWTRRLGRRYLRLDCEAHRSRLRAMYEGAGYTHHSDRQVGPYFVSRYVLDLAALPVGGEAID